MAFNKRTWKGRQGTGLNKFSINGATPVTVINQPDSVTEQGDALSAGNLNDLEQRIYDAFDDIADGTQIVGKATADALGNVIDQTYATKADLQDGTLVVKEAEIASKDEDGNNIKATYETKAEASDLKSAITAIDHRVENLEQPKGGYVVENYKDGSVTPSGKGNWAVVEGLRGVSRVENNLGKAINSTNWESYSSTYTDLSFADGVATVSWKASASSGETYRYGFKQKSPYNIYAGHLYLISYEIYTSKDLRYVDESLMGSYLGPTPAPICEANKWTKIAYVVSASANNNTRTSLIYPNYNQSFVEGDYYRVRNYILTDLSVYFGTTDLAWIGSTYAERIATIQKDYPHLLTPSEYGVRIVDSSYSGVRAWSRNMFDRASATVGKYYDSTGNLYDNSNLGVSDYIPVIPSVAYYLKSVAVVDQFQLHWFDRDKNWIGRNFGSVSNTSMDAPLGASYVRVNFQLSDSQVCFNRSDSLNGTFTPFFESTLSLTFQGKSAGSVYDSCEPNVEVEGVAKKRTVQRVGSYTFTGQEAWGQNTSYANPFFYLTISDMEVNTTENSYCLLCAEYASYKTVSSGNYGGTSADRTICKRVNQNWIMCQDSRYADASSFAQSMAGKTIYYPLATESVTLSDPLIDNTLLTEAGGRMATVQTGTVVDGSFDMGFINL